MVSGNVARRVEVAVDWAAAARLKRKLGRDRSRAEARDKDKERKRTKARLKEAGDLVGPWSTEILYVFVIRFGFRGHVY